jgi:hypothetical protein
MIVFPGVRGIIRRVGIPTLPEVPLTVTPTLWYRPEYIYDELNNLITTTDTPVEYWQPYNNSAANIFNIFVDSTGGGGGGTTAPIKQDPTADYGGMYLSKGTLSNNIQQLSTEVDGNPIEFSSGVTTVGPVYQQNVPCMGNRPAVYFDGTGGYLKVNTNQTAVYASRQQKPWTIGTAICLVSKPTTETVLITIGNADLDTVYYSICADNTNIYIKSNTGNYTVVSSYSTDTPYRIVIHKFYRSGTTTNPTVARVFVNGTIATTTLGFTPTNFPQNVNYYWQFKLFNTALFHLGDFLYWQNPTTAASINWTAQPFTFYNYFNTKYGATN